MADATKNSTIHYVSAVRWSALKREFAARRGVVSTTRDDDQD
ncbi:MULTISPECIES: hypothetical protein [Cryobacterium]|jgi:hypothetical protein|nr:MULTISPECIES: hypothetical protein [Cryobacterium]MDY7542075.1 hypothetical protein [Cryobacterium sp. 5B3]MEB0000006.1 hypothetical protein [Cryobacterium sp. RTS3]MEB0266163.1 hypothetical protein [Cryobacterium sp. 10I5]MEB0275486.1 hypothetical protein [Cryobacterium sp. 5B3]